jgi:hypothetical protein
MVGLNLAALLALLLAESMGGQPFFRLIALLVTIEGLCWLKNVVQAPNDA